MTLSVRVVGPCGATISESGLDRIVVRRREADHDPGSEIVICPRHAPLLMQTQPCRMRLRREGGFVREIEVGAGVLEVCGDEVTIALT